MRIIFFITILFIFSPGLPAHAYLDPGTGGMLLQLLLGGVAGLVVILKLYWGKLKTVFGSKRSESLKEEEKQKG